MLSYLLDALVLALSICMGVGSLLWWKSLLDNGKVLEEPPKHTHDLKGYEMTSFKVKDLSAWEDQIEGGHVRVCGRHCVCDEIEDDFELEEKLEQLTCMMSQIPLRPGNVFNKDMLVSFVRDGGIGGLESSMKEPGANIEALSRTKRLFSEIISNMDSLLEKLVETDSLVIAEGEPKNK